MSRARAIDPYTVSEDDEDDRRRSPVMASLRSADRLYSGYSWTHRILSWLFATTTVAVIGVTGTSLVYDFLFPQARVIAAAEIEPEEALSQRLGERSQVFSIAGYDHRGQRATFDVIVLDKAYTWQRASTSELSEDGKLVSPTTLIETVLGGPVKAQLQASRGVIAVGVASQEGEIDTETQRAGDRAEQTARWLRALLGPSKPLWTLNLGKYRESGRNFDAGTTSWQRPFIVIGVNSAERGIDMPAALADAMRGKSNLPSPRSYTSFAMAVVEQ